MRRLEPCGPAVTASFETRLTSLLRMRDRPHTTGTRLAATAAGEITSMSSGTRQRSV
jgi:hypothetical protein